jgi:hypothetical protein
MNIFALTAADQLVALAFNLMTHSGTKSTEHLA